MKKAETRNASSARGTRTRTRTPRTTREMAKRNLFDHTLRALLLVL